MPSTLDAPRKLSKLEAVNTILEAYGQDTVSALGSTSYASKAEGHLIRALNPLYLKYKMNFSTTPEEVWTPNEDGEIWVSPDVVKMVPDGSYYGRDYIEQDGRIYNREDNTYVFDGEVTFSTTRFKGWEDLPLAARWYVTMAACVSFLVTLKPGDPALPSYREALAGALGALEMDDTDRSGANVTDHSPFFARARGRARSRRNSI